MEVYVRPFPETATAKWQVSTTGGAEPVWSPDGRELFYINGKTEMIAAEIRPGATFSVGEQRKLFPVDPYLRPGSYPRYAVSPDGRRFVMIREGQLSQQSELILTENWLQVLRGKP
jgi:Tol biopolymer transport system component